MAGVLASLLASRWLATATTMRLFLVLRPHFSLCLLRTKSPSPAALHVPSPRRPAVRAFVVQGRFAEARALLALHSDASDERLRLLGVCFIPGQGARLRARCGRHEVIKLWATGVVVVVVDVHVQTTKGFSAGFTGKVFVPVLQGIFPPFRTMWPLQELLERVPAYYVGEPAAAYVARFTAWQEECRGLAHTLVRARNATAAEVEFAVFVHARERQTQ